MQHAAGTLGNRQQGVNTVQGPPGTGTPITGGTVITTAGKGGGRPATAR
ncbi:MAG: hypothetical protein ACLSUW_06955 [Akkermansia sp.]